MWVHALKSGPLMCWSQRWGSCEHVASETGPFRKYVQSVVCLFMLPFSAFFFSPKGTKALRGPNFVFLYSVPVSVSMGGVCFFYFYFIFFYLWTVYRCRTYWKKHLDHFSPSFSCRIKDLLEYIWINHVCFCNSFVSLTFIQFYKNCTFQCSSLWSALHEYH